MFCSKEILFINKLQTVFCQNTKGCGIIYCRTRDGCEEIAGRLSRKGLPCRAYHGGLAAGKRTDVQDSWMCGETPIIAATISFGMGVDKKNVRSVYCVFLKLDCNNHNHNLLLYTCGIMKICL